MLHNAREEIHMPPLASHHHQPRRARLRSALVAAFVVVSSVTSTATAASPDRPMSPGVVVLHGFAHVRETISGVYLFHWDGTTFPA
jgi:hypothetical protein